MRRLVFAAIAVFATTSSAQLEIVSTTGEGIIGQVKIFDATGTLTNTFFPFGEYHGGMSVAVVDINNDFYTDIIMGAGPGAPGGHVKVFDGKTGAFTQSFLAFPGFTGGVNVAVGDVDHDTVADIICGAGAGAANGHVKVFSGYTGAVLHDFSAFDGFSGGVTVASGDINGDLFDDIIVGAGPGAAGGHVKVFDGKTGALIRSFLSFPGYPGGVTVAAGDVNRDGVPDIIVGAGPGAPGGHVKVFDGRTGALLYSFFAFNGFTGGVRVASFDIDGDGFADIIVGAGPGAPGGHVKVFSGRTGAQIRSFFSYEAFNGGVFVGAGAARSS